MHRNPQVLWGAGASLLSEPLDDTPVVLYQLLKALLQLLVLHAYLYLVHLVGQLFRSQAFLHLGKISLLFLRKTITFFFFRQRKHLLI